MKLLGWVILVLSMCFQLGCVDEEGVDVPTSDNDGLAVGSLSKQTEYLEIEYAYTIPTVDPGTQLHGFKDAWGNDSNNNNGGPLCSAPSNGPSFYPLSTSTSMHLNIINDQGCLILNSRLKLTTNGETGSFIIQIPFDTPLTDQSIIYDGPGTMAFSGYYQSLPLDERTMPITKQYEIRITFQVQDSQTFDWKETVLYSTTSNTISANSPAGDVLAIGQNIDIDWTSSGSINSVDISYSTDDGFSFAPPFVTTSNDGFFVWQIPTLISAQCRIRISDSSDPSVNGVTPKFAIGPTVTISGPPSLQKFKTGIFTASTSHAPPPGETYVYAWKRRVGFGPWTDLLGTSQTQSIDMGDSWMTVKVEVSIGGLVGVGTKLVECSNCGGHQP